MTFHEIPLRFILLKKESNIENQLRWLAYIAGDEFVADWKEAMQTGGHLSEMISSARKIVEELIYSFNTTDGTGKIKRSISGTYPETEEAAEFAVYSDPNIAPSKGPFASGDPQKFSYAAFFEDPKFNTFLPPKDNPTDTRRYRPFFGAMTKDQQRINQQIAFRTIMRTIRRRMSRMTE